jgi:anaerobic magnesium-protoporphyrin IX monomethyl ester cyclase
MLKKLRFIEPGDHSPYRDSLLNAFIYNKHIKNPSTGLNTLATIAKRRVADTLMYSESISIVDFDDVVDADIVFIGINTFNAVRGYEIADWLRANSKAIVVLGGLHASLNYPEAVEHCDYVLLGDADESILEFIDATERGTPIDFTGVVFKRDGEVVRTGERAQPQDIDTIPDRSLVYGYSRAAKLYDTLWPQVHASRGCPHDCDYCTVVRHFGRKIRKRSPANVVADIRDAIEFHRRPFIPRLNTIVWITDDNFPHDREWAISVLKAIIASGIRYHFSVQARFEVGFDDEMLDLMKKAGFVEVALGIEFIDDESFLKYHKRSKRAEIERAIANIRAHGLGARGLFIVGAERDTKGIGKRIADFAIRNGIHGALVQSMFFTPGTPVYEENKDRLIHTDWNKYNGNVVHYPAHMKPHELQWEIIDASRRLYSLKRLFQAVARAPGVLKILFIGEFCWQASMRRDLWKEMKRLEKVAG